MVDRTATEVATVYPFFGYRDAPAAMDWLERRSASSAARSRKARTALSCTPSSGSGPGGVMLGSENGDVSDLGDGTYIVAAETSTSSYERAKAAGAEIVREVADTQLRLARLHRPRPGGEALGRRHLPPRASRLFPSEASKPRPKEARCPLHNASSRCCPTRTARRRWTGSATCVRLRGGPTAGSTSDGTLSHGELRHGDELIMLATPTAGLPEPEAPPRGVRERARRWSQSALRHRRRAASTSTTLDAHCERPGRPAPRSCPSPPTRKPACASTAPRTSKATAGCSPRCLSLPAWVRASRSAASPASGSGSTGAGWSSSR